MDEKKELERAYRALQAFYRAHVDGRRLPEAAVIYHSMTIAAAIRFVDEDKLEGADYFVGKQFDVLHEVLRRARS